MNSIKAKTGLIVLLYIGTFLNAQVSPFSIPPTNFSGVYTSGIQNNTVVNAALNTVNVSSSAVYSIKAGNYVRIMTGSSAGNFSSGSLHAWIESSPLDVVSYHTNGFVNIPRYDKFELGIKLPPTITQKIDNFFGEYPQNVDGINTGGGHNGYGCVYNTSNGNINPYDPDQISVEATFSTPGQPSKTIYGFYYREFTYSTGDPNITMPPSYANTYWIEDLNLQYHWRVRFAPKQIGTYTVTWKVKTDNGTTVVCEDNIGQSFNVVISNNPGFLKLGQTKHFLVTQPDPAQAPKTILPIGIVEKIPLEPIGYSLDNADRNDKDVIPASECSPYGCPDLHYPSRYFKHRNEIKTLVADYGGNLVRVWSLHDGYETEHEHAGIYDSKQNRPVQNCLNTVPVSNLQNAGYNFSGSSPAKYNGTSRQAIMWEFDRLLDMAKENNVYIQWVLNDPDDRFKKVGWKAMHPYASIITPPLSDDVDQLFTDANAKKAWKNKLRYIIARYGYSTNIAAFEMFNEHDFLKDNMQGSTPLNSVFAPWLQEMTDFIKGPSGLNHHDHLLTLSFSAEMGSESNSGQINNLDFLSVHPYTWHSPSFHGAFDLIQKVKQTIDPANVYGYNKPCQAGEMGLGDWSGFTKPMFPEFMAPSSHALMWSTTFIGGLTSGLEMWYNGLRISDHQTNPPLVCGEGYSQHFKPLQEFIKNIDFDGKQYSPKWFWNSADIEAYYMINNNGSAGTEAIGYARNRTFWWENFSFLDGPFYDNTITTRFNTGYPSTITPPVVLPSNIPVTLGTFIVELDGLKAGSTYEVKWYNTYVDPTLVNPVISTEFLVCNSNNKLIMNPPEFIEDCQRQEYGFKVVEIGNRPANEAAISINSNETISSPYQSKETLFFHLLSIYPNPTSDKIYIRYRKDIQEELTLKMYDLSGRLVLKQVDVNEISTSGLENGVYILKISSGSLLKSFKINVSH